MNRIHTAIHNNDPKAEVYLFGSRAHGNILKQGKLTKNLASYSVKCLIQVKKRLWRFV
jgi:hypothetical protein